MATSIRDLMTPDPRMVQPTATIREVAQMMRDDDIGAVLVRDDGETLRGILTDRDITIRAVAEGLEPDSASAGDICSADLDTIHVGDDAGEAVGRMRREGIRRLPVMDGDTPVGILSLGDLAIELDPDSALADISAQPGNR